MIRNLHSHSSACQAADSWQLTLTAPSQTAPLYSPVSTQLILFFLSQKLLLPLLSKKQLRCHFYFSITAPLTSPLPKKLL
jgi:hypothetical protein